MCAFWFWHKPQAHLTHWLGFNGAVCVFTLYVTASALFCQVCSIHENVCLNVEHTIESIEELTDDDKLISFTFLNYENILKKHQWNIKIIDTGPCKKIVIQDGYLEQSSKLGSLLNNQHELVKWFIKQLSTRRSMKKNPFYLFIFGIGNCNKIFRQQ